MAAENKKADKRREEYTANRILAVFTYAFLLILGLMAAYRSYTNIDTMFVTRTVLYVIAALGAAGVIAGIVWEYAGEKREYKLLCGRNIALAAAILAVCAFCGAYFGTAGVRMMYVFVPIVSALILVYYLYPRDFFFNALVCACGALTMWYISNNVAYGFVWTNVFYFGRAMILSTGALVLLACYAVCTKFLAKSGGVVVLRGRETEVLPRNAKFSLGYITAAFVAVCILAGLICGATAAYYLVFAVVAYLFILTVYYTVKML